LDRNYQLTAIHSQSFINSDMKKILVSLLFLVAAVASFAQIDSINYPARKMPFGNWDFIWTNGTLTDTVKVYPEKGGIGLDTLFFGDGTTLSSDTGLVKTTGDSIYGKITIFGSDTMLSIRGGGMNVIDGSVLFSGTTGTTPASGAGTRLMWIPEKAAFRAGGVDGTQWDDSLVGHYSIAMGQGTTASKYYSTAMGEGTTASAYNSTALGQRTTASSQASTAMGKETTASGFVSTAMGEGTTASGDYSTAMGKETTASGHYSTAMGKETTANSSYLFTIGSLNDTTHSTSKDGWVSTDPVFQIGNGTGRNRNNDAFRVLKNGKTYIGDSSSTTDAILVVDPTDSTSTFIGTVSVEKSVKVGNDTEAASAANVGAIRYRSDANNSYCEMVMQIGASSYAWVEIKQNTW
jgi:hypothetical protein